MTDVVIKFNFSGARNNPPSYTCDGSNCPGSAVGILEYGGPTVYWFHEAYYNQTAVGAKLAGLVGVLTNNAALEREATLYFQEALQFSTFPSGEYAEQYRWSDCSPPCPGSSWGHIGADWEALVLIADTLARAGDTSLYTYSTSNGQFGSQGGPKSLLTMAQRYAGMVNGTIRVYGTTDGSQLNDSTLLTWIDPTYGKYYNDLVFMIGNIYYRDGSVHTAMTRQEGSDPYNSCAGSAFGCYTGGIGLYPDLPFMLGDMEGKVNPYGIGGSTPTPTPSSSPSQKFKIGDRVQPTADVTVHSYAAFLDTNVVRSQPAGAQGTVVGGPTLGTDGVWWWQIDYDSGADGWNGEVILTKSTAPSPTPTVTACHLYTPTSTIPIGFGSPFDVVTSPSTNLIQASCTTSNASINLGKGDPLQYIYNTGYLYKTGATNWSPKNYTSTEQLIAGAWYPKTANTTIAMTSTELANPSYALGYLCTWVGSTWKCGCRDSACTQSYWQIQSFKK